MLKVLLVLVPVLSALAAPVPGKRAGLDDAEKARRMELGFKAEPGPETAARVRAMALSLREKAVPGLIKVMKDATFPEKNRWHATMLLGQIMGKKSAPFIARFSEHPAWMMRVASLKALAALGMREYHAVYARALRDPSLIVRVQALDNITRMDIRELAPQVWTMMYDQTNYAGDAGKRQRTSIVRSVIRTVGELKYDKARAPLARLIQKPRYADLADDLDYSLEKITGKVSPQGGEAQRAFWAKTVASR